MIGITTNATEAGDAIARKRDALAAAIGGAMRSALLATESEAVKRLSGSNSDPSYAYPVPARTGNLRRDRTVQQPEPGIGLISFLSDYAWAVHSGHVTEWAGRGRTRQVDRMARPFADDAVEAADPSHFFIDAVQEALAA